MLPLRKLRESDYVANMLPEPSTFELSSAPSSLSTFFLVQDAEKLYVSHYTSVNMTVRCWYATELNFPARSIL
jgi:hypothetical protein